MKNINYSNPKNIMITCPDCGLEDSLDKFAARELEKKIQKEFIDDAENFDSKELDTMKKEELLEAMLKLPKNSLKRRIIFNRYMEVHIKEIKT